MGKVAGRWCGFGALLALSVAALPAAAAVQYRWVQLVEGETLGGILQPRVLVRAIVGRGDPCPTLFAADGRAAALMMERPRDPALASFDAITLCQAAFDASDPLLRRFTPLFFDPQGTQPAGVLPDLSHGVPLSSLIAFGCTGCRGRKNEQPQCDPDTEWFFGRINDDAARRTRDRIPPLVTWLGDVRYAGQRVAADEWSARRTEGSDTVLGWREEVFEPTRALMERGLWVPLRGNHEACLVEGNDWSDTGWNDRGSAWLWFFGDGDRTCADVAGPMGDVLPPFAIDATLYGGNAASPVPSDQTVRMVFLDTVRTGDDRDQDLKGTRRLYRESFDRVAERFVAPLADERPVWLFSHIPAWSLKKDFEATILLEALGGSELDAHLDRIPLAAAAHVHRFNLVNPGMGNPGGPVQFVAGNGGVALSGSDGDLVCKQDEVAWTPAGGKERDEDWAGVRTSNFGYLLASFALSAGKVSADYRAPIFDATGTPAPNLEVACTGNGSDWSRLSCPAFTTGAGTPQCAIKN